jgi:LPXTG-motif cell wall-anchored protein
MMRMYLVRTLAAAATLTAGTIAVVSSPVDAGEPVTQAGVFVEVIVNGPNAPALAGDLTVEVYQDAGSGSPGSEVDPLDCNVVLSATGPYSGQQDATCGLVSGDYIIGLDGVPANWTVTGSCTSGDEQPTEALDLGGAETFSYFGATDAECTLFVSASVLLIDKVVVGGSASSDDFTIQVLDAADNPVASGSDVADATCEADFDTAKCGVIAMPSGVGFQIAEPTVADYELTSVECDEFVNAEFAPQGGAVVTDIGDDGFRTDDGDTYCVITNTYVPPPTTTTTLATTTTTIAPTTTLAPTTTIDAGVVTLPATGTSAEANGWLTMMAIALVAAGGAMLLARRRYS